MKIPLLRTTLREFSLSSLLEALGIGRQYLLVELGQAGVPVGTLVLKSGKVVRAEAGGSHGFEAWLRLLECTEGEVEVFRSETPSTLPEPLGAIDVLLSQAAERAAARSARLSEPGSLLTAEPAPFAPAPEPHSAPPPEQRSFAESYDARPLESALAALGEPPVTLADLPSRALAAELQSASSESPLEPAADPPTDPVSSPPPTLLTPPPLPDSAEHTSGYPPQRRMTPPPLPTATQAGSAAPPRRMTPPPLPRAAQQLGSAPPRSISPPPLPATAGAISSPPPQRMTPPPLPTATQPISVPPPRRITPPPLPAAKAPSAPPPAAKPASEVPPRGATPAPPPVARSEAPPARRTSPPPPNLAEIQRAKAALAGRLLAVTSPKGGCGKTTIALNLALSLARQGRSVILVDADPNGDVLSTINARERAEIGAFDVLLGVASSEEALLDTVLPHFKILPAVGGQLPRAELLAADHSAAWRALLFELGKRADVVIIDTPAGMYGVTHQVSQASTHVIGVLQAEVVANRSFGRFLEALRAIPDELRPEVLGIVINMLQTKHTASLSVFQSACCDLPGDWLFDTSIPRHRAFLDATQLGLPLRHLDEQSPPAVAFLFDNLAAEVADRLRLGSVEKKPQPLLL